MLAMMERNRASIAAMQERLAQEHRDAPRTQPQNPFSSDLWARSLLEYLSPCVYGTPDVCDDLVEIVQDCGQGDSRSCVAAAQFIEDTPPHALAGEMFWFYACKQGDADACARWEQLKTKPARCAEDPTRCGWYAFKHHDLQLQLEACDASVADGCAIAASTLAKTEPERALGLIERACELGFVYSCSAVGRAYSFDCVPDDDNLCAPSDPERSRAAFALACAAGDETSCR
jgi:hypothetical protein